MAETIIKIKDKRKKRKQSVVNPNSLKNLKPYVKGQSGNPSGRPRGTGEKKISAAYEAMLSQKVPKSMREKLGIDGDDVTWSDLIAFRMVTQAIDPNQLLVSFNAVQELREVTEGKVPDKIEQTGKDGEPLAAGVPPITVNFVKAPGDKPSKK